MQSLERHALYNLIRMNWLNDPKLPVEPWQVEDYRALHTPTLFERLFQFSIQLDRTSFIAFAEECDSPEELAEHLIGDKSFDAKTEDQIYLLVFELWRRLLTEKPSLSILCNELDYQIYLNDKGEAAHLTGLQDALANFALLLNENVDEGLSPQEAFKLIAPYFANDIESFLYDYIYDLIDEDNESYAQDLLDNFAPYLKGNKWFELLYVRLIEHSNARLADKMLTHLMEDYLDENDLNFNLELLNFMVDSGNMNDFKSLMEKSMKLIQKEEDFNDLLNLCIDYFHRLDKEKLEQETQALLTSRSSIHPEKTVSQNDADVKKLAKILQI